MSQNWLFIAHLGTGAFETISGEVVNAATIIFGSGKPNSKQTLSWLNVSSEKKPAEKASALKNYSINKVNQLKQLKNPGFIINVDSYNDQGKRKKKCCVFC